MVDPPALPPTLEIPSLPTSEPVNKCRFRCPQFPPNCRARSGLLPTKHWLGGVEQGLLIQEVKPCSSAARPPSRCPRRSHLAGCDRKKWQNRKPARGQWQSYVGGSCPGMRLSNGVIAPILGRRARRSRNTNNGELQSVVKAEPRFLRSSK